MKEVMEDINEAKQEMCDNAPKRKRTDTTDETKSKRRRVQSEEVVQVRRSERERKSVIYVVDENDGRRSRIKKKNSSNYQPEASNYVEASSSAGPEGQGSSSRTLRPQKPVCYTENPEPDVDSYIWCKGCDRLKYYGSETNFTLWGKVLSRQRMLDRAYLTKGRRSFLREQSLDHIQGTVFEPYTGDGVR